MGSGKVTGVIVLVMCFCVSLQADSTKTKRLPPGIIKALAGEEKDFCDQFLGDYNKGCHQKFRSKLLWRELKVAQQGRTAILVENHNMGFCGSAGCSLYLFALQADANFIQVLGKIGDVGALDSITILKTISAGHYDIQKMWRDGKTRTVYRWDGQRYSGP